MTEWIVGRLKLVAIVTFIAGIGVSAHIPLLGVLLIFLAILLY
jgi:hypothetical protein